MMCWNIDCVDVIGMIEDRIDGDMLNELVAGEIIEFGEGLT